MKTKTAIAGRTTGCRLCLATERRYCPESFCSGLPKILDEALISSIRLSLAADKDEDLKRAAEELLRAVDGTDVSVIVEARPDLARQLGLHGVHLPDGPKRIGQAREFLDAEQVIGAFCGATRHAGLQAGEAGADYVSFGPVGGLRPASAEIAQPELFAWWREFTVLPCMAEGGISKLTSPRLLASLDFLMLGADIWETDSPIDAIASIKAVVA